MNVIRCIRSFLGLFDERANPAAVVAHPAQATQVDQRGTDQAGHGRDRLQHDGAIAIALGKKGVGEESQRACDDQRDPVGPIIGRVVGIQVDGRCKGIGDRFH
jgi:hypothetical protein